MPVCNKYIGKTAKRKVPQTTKNYSLPEGLIKFLKDKLRKPAFLLHLYDDGTLKKIPNATMGNKIYAWLREGRIQNAIKGLLSAKDKTLLFITLTHKYDPRDLKSSWLFFTHQLPKYIRKIRKLGGDAYIAVKEAHKKGGCHVHMIVRWNKELPSKTYIKYNKKKKRNEVRQILTDGKLFNELKEAWEGHTDIQVITDEKVGAYLTKELGKQSHIEQALKNYDSGNLSDRDIKKLWTIYCATKYKTRLICTSRNLPAVEVDEGEEPTPDLITDMNNTTDKPKLIKIVVAPWYIKNSPVFKPYTGTVKRESEEYRFLMHFIHNADPPDKYLPDD